MSDDITQKLRATMPDFKGLEISCPCRIRSLLMKDAADEIEKLTRQRDEARYFLRVFVHACANNNSVPPHIEGQAREALEANP